MLVGSGWNAAMLVGPLPPMSITIFDQGKRPYWSASALVIFLRFSVGHLSLLTSNIVVWYGLGGRVTTNFGGVDVVPLLGAIVVCYCCGEGRRTLGVDVVPLQGACGALWWGQGRVRANFGGVDVVPGR